MLKTACQTIHDALASLTTETDASKLANAFLHYAEADNRSSSRLTKTQALRYGNDNAAFSALVQAMKSAQAVIKPMSEHLKYLHKEHQQAQQKQQDQQALQVALEQQHSQTQQDLDEQDGKLTLAISQGNLEVIEALVKQTDKAKQALHILSLKGKAIEHTLKMLELENLIFHTLLQSVKQQLLAQDKQQRMQDERLIEPFMQSLEVLKDQYLPSERHETLIQALQQTLAHNHQNLKTKHEQQFIEQLLTA